MWWTRPGVLLSPLARFLTHECALLMHPRMHTCRGRQRGGRPRVPARQLHRDEQAVGAHGTPGETRRCGRGNTAAFRRSVRSRPPIGSCWLEIGRALGLAGGGAEQILTLRDTLDTGCVVFMHSRAAGLSPRPREAGPRALAAGRPGCVAHCCVCVPSGSDLMGCAAAGSDCLMPAVVSACFASALSGLAKHLPTPVAHPHPVSRQWART